MGLLLCPRCQRANPTEARFCHYDGAELRAGPGGVYRGGELGREFVFPTGRRCKTFDDLVRGCSAEWPAAREMLRQGGLQQFMAGIGRMDLVRAAQEAAQKEDPDIALDSFLAQLPTRDINGPQLDLVPRRLNLGKLGVGQSKQCQLMVVNQGARLLHGTIQAEGGEWVRIGAGANGVVPIKTGKQQQLTLFIDTFGLVAGQRYTARLTVITNGGVVEVPITMELIGTPFPYPPLQGAASPRDLAALMKEHPKEVGPLLESGAVLRWFEANGWRYPVQTQSAKGIAAVQQFFEAMGLSMPPQVQVAEKEVLMICRRGQTVQGRITLTTPAKKWVYARIESDSSWLYVLTPDVSGAQKVSIEFEGSARGLEGNKHYDGRLHLVANGGQRLSVPVKLDVQAKRIGPSRRLVRVLLIGALGGFLVRLLIGVLILAGGFLAQQLSLADATPPNLASLGSWLKNASPDFVAHFALAAAGFGTMIGVGVLWRRSGFRDVLSGLVVGGVTALALGVTLACLVKVVDGLFGQLLPFDIPGIALAAWTAAGVGLALVLSVLGRSGRSIVAVVGRGLAGVARMFGLKELAERLGEE